MKKKSAKQSKKGRNKQRDLKPKGSVRGGAKEQVYFTVELKNATVSLTENKR